MGSNPIISTTLNKLMEGNVIFNATICIIGIAIIFTHVVNLIIKKNRRKDENQLLLFLVFTIVHFATYLTFTFIKVHFIKINYSSDAFVIAFYTIFYIFNNIEVFLLFLYMLAYVGLKDKLKLTLSIINLSVFLVFIGLDIVNIFTHMFFYAQSGNYERTNIMIISQGYQFILFVVIFLTALLNKKLVIREKIAFGCYCVLPFVAIILQNLFKGYAIAYASIIISIEIMFSFLTVQKNIQLAEEKEMNKEAQIKVMMSQIQPHFIYNSLSSISALITINPESAQKALDNFTEYLRHNLLSLTETKLIPFSEELKHIKTYISLEKVRFNDRINVNYDIQTTDFGVPPLSVQPIVENAIKHGILKRIEGGTLNIKTYEKEDRYIVEIIDDGVGFDINLVDFSKNKHVGLLNIQTRLKTMGNGDISISSEIDKGTKVTLTFYKKVRI